VEEPQERRGLPRLLLRFPYARNALTSRYISDSDFRALCAAYEDAHDALKMREQASTAITREMADYQQLVLDMESDIIDLVPRDYSPRLKRADANTIMTFVTWGCDKLFQKLRR
jgi:hypothetical protein